MSDGRWFNPRFYDSGDETMPLAVFEPMPEVRDKESLEAARAWLIPISFFGNAQLPPGWFKFWGVPHYLGPRYWFDPEWGIHPQPDRGEVE